MRKTIFVLGLFFISFFVYGSNCGPNIGTGGSGGTAGAGGTGGSSGTAGVGGIGGSGGTGGTVTPTPTLLPNAPPTATATTPSSSGKTLFIISQQYGGGTVKATSTADFANNSCNLWGIAPVGYFTPNSTSQIVTITASGIAAAARPMIQVKNSAGTQTMSVFNPLSNSNTTTLTFTPVDTSVYSLYVVDIGQAPVTHGIYTVQVTQ